MPEAPHKAIVARICALPWQACTPADLQNIMHLSYVSALEFAAGLRLALQLYPESASLQEMAAGELMTENLSFPGYAQKADHAAFLGHFLSACPVPVSEDVKKAGAVYARFCAELAPATRAASIFSREAELPHIFRHILQAPNWQGPGLPAYRYYLEQHIQLDTAPGGHHDLTKNLPMACDLVPFYRARLSMYLSIPTLRS